MAAKVRVVSGSLGLYQDIWQRMEVACETVDASLSFEDNRVNCKWLPNSHIMTLKWAWEYVSAILHNPTQAIRL